MSNLPPQCYVDAPGWSDTVTVTQTYNYTSPDGKTTITGTATFTYARVKLADKLGNPKLPCADYTFIPNEVSDDSGDDSDGDESGPFDGKFLAVSSALGVMPGWVAVFGAQDTQTGVFTRTTTNSSGTPPTVTKLDANCNLFASCTLVAPGRRIGGEDSRTLLYPLGSGGAGINFGVGDGDLVDHASFSVTLVQPGVPANDLKKQAAIPPVYRVSLSTDANLLSSFSLTVNGTESGGFPDPLSGGGLPGFIRGAFSDLNYTSGATLSEPLTPWSCDVQMANYGDTLGAGKLAYYKTKPLDSSLTASPGGSKTIPNPFPMAGQSFTVSDSGDGLSVTIQF